MRSRFSNSLWGLFFILIGFGFAGNALDLWDFNLFFPGWWTFFIIIPCGISIIQDGFRTGNSIGLVIGIMLLLSRLGLFNMYLTSRLIVPIILVVVGINILFSNASQRRSYRGHYFGPTTPGSADSMENMESMENSYNDSYNANDTGNWQDTQLDETAVYTSTFSSQNVNFDNELFLGATANAYFGSTSLYLENAIINEDVAIYCNATFGGIEIFLPSYVNVQVRSTPIFGGVTNRRRYPQNPAAPIVFIIATCMFGGVEVK